MNNELKNIYYIDIPDNFKLNVDSFTLDKNIKLPIETNGLDSWTPEDISWESIISAMLKILAYDKENENLCYYRNFIIAVRPDIIEALTDSAIYKSNAKEFKLAKEIFLAIDGLKPGDDRNSLNMAVLFENEAEWQKEQGDTENYNRLINSAAEIYKSLLDRDSVLNDVYFNAGFFFMKIRKFENAEVCLNSYIEYSNDEDKIKEAKKLLNDFKSIIGNEDILNEVYRLILEEREHEAVATLNNFIAENDQIWNAWFLLGWANRRLSNFSEAISSLERSLSLNSDDSDTYNELSICYMEQGDFTQSRNYLLEALKINPDDVKIISNLGIIELKQGNNNEAIKYFETVLVYEPEDSIAKHYLEQLK